ncbi:MarR family transcriptional regulator [Streptomyces sp. NPDC003717]|uniref:MarR family transcriptional regulator n=1 Tax=Streptomyces sp. NPDC003717 TaxID=3154276 RepID=UPI0033AF28C7
MTTTAPVADARALGLAHYAARGLLEHFLAAHGLTFERQVALRVAVTAEAPLTPDELAARARGALKSGPDAVRADLDRLVAERLLVADGPHLRPTEAGRELLAAVGAEVAPHAARVWDGIPAADLAAAGRVLALVTERAEAELRLLAA